MDNANYQLLKSIQKRKLEKALQHLFYSYEKIKLLPINVDSLDEESLEVWESFSARFARVAEIFLSQYLRTLVLLSDPGFNGTMRDFVNQAEKIKIIDDANAWMSIRQLRNINAHEYSEKDLAEYFDELRRECPRLLNIKKLLEKE